MRPIRTALFALLGLLVVACGESHGLGDDDAGPASCVAAGGRCQSPDLACDGRFGGYDRCGDVPNDACCLPAPPDEDAGAPPSDAGPPPAPDAGPGPGAGRIACGDHECDATIEGCMASCLYATDEVMPACLRLDDGGRWPAGMCPTGRESFPRHWLTCDGAEDCGAGELCHMQYGSAGQYAFCETCADGCDLRFFEVLCRSDADCPSEVPRCTPTDALLGYSTCE